ncbi:DNA polymerase III subunit alpha [candidate division KSB1 bacterium]
MSEFIHLHNHTTYSLLDCASKIGDLVKAAKQNNMDALAITDHGNMFGVIEFYKAAMKVGIKPIVGMEGYLARGSKLDKTYQGGISQSYYHITLLVKNNAGYKNLIKLSSTGYLEGFYYRPRIDKDDLKKHGNGLIGLSGCLHGELPQLILNNNYNEAKKAARHYLEIFEGEFYIEIMDHGIEEELIVKPQLIQLAKELDIPLVATNDGHYIKQEHSKAQEILLCISSGKELSDPTRFKHSTDQLYFKTIEEMKEIFKETPEAVNNTVKIAEKCNLLIDFNKHYLPNFNVPEDSMTLDDYLSSLANEGMKKRYPEEVTPEIKDRLNYELSIIKKMGFSGYFLIVQDLINYARQNGIPVGPGRGSAAGSLVSYVLGITNLNPIDYNLIFERFLNPERISMPDIDIDFCYERRNEVINYTVNKYGEDSVAQIITFGTLSAKAVVRDVGRVMGVPYSDVDRIAKLIPNILNINLDKALKMVPELKEMEQSRGVYAELLKYSKILEGLVRHASTHAAGVVIAPAPLKEFVPLYRNIQGSKTKIEGENRVLSGEITTQYSMKYVEAIGLLKMDFLGLRTLTVIDKVIKALHKRVIDIDINNLPLDDKNTYHLFSRGETIGVFQFESAGMRDYMKKLKPERLEDLIAMNALYRPGPMDMINDFIDRKHGRKKIEYLHPLLEDILKETYGIIVYQEQVIRIASDLGGFSKGKGDQLRRAMGKKNVEIMQALRDEFVEGSVERNIKKNIASGIFELMNKFAGYGFNKSHAAGYALVAYQTAYLKSNYPHEFMACTISSEMDRTDRVVILIDECRRMEIDILEPEVNESFYDFVVTDGKIRFGLGAVKNVGKNAIESIVSARKEEGNFKTLFDFCRRVDLRLVNRKVIESLIQIGAMDSVEGTRIQKYNSIDSAIAFGQKSQEERKKHQTNIFDMVQTEDNRSYDEPVLAQVSEEWTKTQMLLKEKELLGFYISGHPLLKYKSEIEEFSTVTVNSIPEKKNNSPVKLGGIITQYKIISDKKNQPMAFVSIEDLSGSTEMILFSDTYKKYTKYIQDDEMVFITGKISTKGDNGSRIICEEILPLKEATNVYAKYLILSLNADETQDKVIEDIENEMKNNLGECPVYFEVKFKNEEYIILESKKYKVSPNSDFISNLKNIIGDEYVTIRS